MPTAGVPLTAAQDCQRKEGYKVPYLVNTGSQIFKGALVCVNSSGKLVPYTDAASLIFAGVAEGSTTNAADNALAVAPAGAIMNVIKTGCFLMNNVTAETFVQANVGSEVYANSDNQVTVTSSDQTNDVKVGRISELVSTTQVYVRIDGYC